MAKKICPSNFNKQILFQSRELLPDNTSVDFSLNFNDGIKVWAEIKTTRGEEVFGDVNTETSVTHIITTRYLDFITSECWILFEGKRYDILDVENIDEDNKFLRLRCNIRGTEDLPRTSF